MFFDDGNQYGLTGVSKQHGLPVSNIPFDVNLEIVRPAAHGAYSTKDVINTGANTTLPYFDLSAYGANKKIIVNCLSVMSDQAAVGTKLQCDARLYAVNNPIADCTDHGAFNPTYANLKNLQAGFVYVDADQPDVGSGAYMAARWRNEQRIVTTDANGRVYLALLAVNAYAPADAEKLYVKLTGFVQ